MIEPQTHVPERRKFIKQSLYACSILYLPFKLPQMFNPKGVVIKNSRKSVEELIDSLIQLLKTKGVTIYTVIDQQKELARTGIIIRPMQYILFGNPLVGGAIIQKMPIAALDLPLKVLIWENDNQEVSIGYNHKSYLNERYGLISELSETLDLESLIATLLKK